MSVGVKDPEAAGVDDAWDGTRDVEWNRTWLMEGRIQVNNNRKTPRPTSSVTIHFPRRRFFPIGKPGGGAPEGSSGADGGRDEDSIGSSSPDDISVPLPPPCP